MKRQSYYMFFRYQKLIRGNKFYKNNKLYIYRCYFIINNDFKKKHIIFINYINTS